MINDQEKKFFDQLIELGFSEFELEEISKMDIKEKKNFFKKVLEKERFYNIQMEEIKIINEEINNVTRLINNENDDYSIFQRNEFLGKLRFKKLQRESNLKNADDNIKVKVGIVSTDQLLISTALSADDSFYAANKDYSDKMGCSVLIHDEYLKPDNIFDHVRFVELNS